MRRRACHAPLGVGLGLVAPFVLSVGAAPAGGTIAPFSGMAATWSGRVEQARSRVRARPEWRGLRRRVSDAPAEPRHLDGCQGKRVEPRRHRAPSAGCGGMSQAFSGLSAVLAVALLVVLVLGILWAVISARAGKPGEDEGEDKGDDGAPAPTTPPGERPVSTYVGRAQAYARAGDYRRALRELLLGGMSWTERQGLIRFRRGLTNRDYLRALGRRPSQRQSMAAVAMEFDKVYFGRRQATSERYERVLPGYLAAFEGGQEGEEASPDAAVSA